MLRPARRREVGEGRYEGAVDQAAAPENRAGAEALREELAADRVRGERFLNGPTGDGRAGV